MAGIKWSGIKELKAVLKTNASLKDVKKVVQSNTKALNRAFHEHTGTDTFCKGYSVGNIRRSIRQDITDGGMTGTVGTNVDYAPYVEHGTRFMDSEPFAKPAFDEVAPKFKKDLDKLVKG